MAALAAGILLLVSGCTPKSCELRAELAAGSRPGRYIPLRFVAQEPNRCGSAALSEVLTYWKAPRSEEPVLAAEVFSESLKGTLNVDLVTAARRRGMVTRDGSSTMTELRSLVAAGYPAVVMINVGPYVLNRKHFLAVKGVDLERGYLMADDGRRGDVVLRPRPFRRDWRASKFWALYCWPPGKAPETATAEEQLRAGLIFEERGRTREAVAAYERARDGNPDLWEASFNLANLSLAGGDLAGAEKQYRAAMAIKADEADVLNNLAYVLFKRGGAAAESEELARRAVACAGERTTARVRARHTLGVVLAAAGRKGDACTELRRAITEAREIKEEDLAAAAQADLDKLQGAR